MCEQRPREVDGGGDPGRARVRRLVQPRQVTGRQPVPGEPASTVAENVSVATRTVPANPATRSAARPGPPQ
ncbi:hypothetical protein [Dactylosporangium sp. CA-233914]|uniref:hypothetical protein n=1 Tax=Dactylosporangium sp. CA-233914 TaxID=3239934 RepID=UPI003D89E7CC